MGDTSPTEVLGAFVADFVEPTMSEVADQTHDAIDIVVLAVTNEVEKAECRTALIPAEAVARRASCEIRAIFRVTNGVGTFSAQCICHGIAPESGYSGFAARGRVDLSLPSRRFLVKARSNRYNVWTWDDEFQGHA